ncbi:MAG: VWA domain-containing protein [Planctomycetia bacterium]|nr:VWA domain-containing protein [Planctomycetia bacterium]
MSFQYPYVLLLLPLAALLLVFVWRRKGRRVVLPFDFGRPGSGWGWRFLIGGAESLLSLLLALAIILLAGPQEFGEPQAKRRLTNIQLCVDISGSMTRPFGDGSAYDAAMQEVEAFLAYRKGDAVGLTFFGNSVLHWCPLTSDLSAVRCAPPFMRPENVPPWFGGTEIGRALRACKSVLVERQEGDRMIILVTDGMSADLFGGAAEDMAREMKANNITVFAILIGTAPLQDEVINIAHATGGEAFQAGDPEALKQVFRRIDDMKQAPVEKTIADLRDQFAPWCVAGLAVLAVSVASAFGLRYTPW